MSSRAAPLIYAEVVDVSGNTERVIEQTHKILEMEYTDSLKKADECTLTIENFDLSHFDSPLWAHGNLLRISWGYPGQMSLTRELIIQKVVGFTRLKITARAKSVLIDAVKRSRTFKNMTRAEVALQIAREYGYIDETLFIEDSKTRYPHITQANISDAQMLKRLAHQQGFEWYVDQDGFHFHEERLSQAPIRTYTYHTAPGRGDVMDIDVQSDITRRPSEVVKKARDPITKQETAVAASNTTDTSREGLSVVTLTRSLDLRTGALSSGEAATAPPISADELSLMSNVAEIPAGPLQSGYTVVESGPLMSRAEDVHTEAKKDFRKAQRGAVKLSLGLIGDPQMLAKSVIYLGGVGQRLSGYYVVREAKHSIGEGGGYKLKLAVVSDGLGPMTERTQKRIEAGIPQVAGAVAQTKKPPTVGEQSTAALITGASQSLGDDALEPVDIKDAQGNVIGTGWREKTGAVVASEKALVIDAKTKQVVQVGG